MIFLYSFYLLFEIDILPETRLAQVTSDSGRTPDIVYVYKMLFLILLHVLWDIVF